MVPVANQRVGRSNLPGRAIESKTYAPGDRKEQWESVRVSSSRGTNAQLPNVIGRLSSAFPAALDLHQTAACVQKPASNAFPPDPRYQSTPNVKRNRQLRGYTEPFFIPHKMHGLTAGSGDV